MNTAQTRSSMDRDGLNGDHLLFATIGASLIAAWLIGLQYGRADAALWIGVPIFVTAGTVWATARGTLFAHMALASLAMAMVALHIHVGMGQNLFHFGVFALLALLLVYRDWRVIVVAAGLIAVQHALFNELQEAGWGVSCFVQPSRAEVALHAIYVIVQTGVEIWIALVLALEARQGGDVRRLVEHMARDGRMNLDLGSVATSTPLGNALAGALAQMRDAVNQVHSAAAQIREGAQAIAAGSTELASRAEEQTNSMQNTGSSIEGLVTSVQQNSTRAKQASDLAVQASDVATRGGSVMRDVVATMGEISESSKKIGDIIGVIDGIAFQTNILALNAAVEAARAGEQGRGFAVVASEVRSLAQRSAAAAKETKDLIGSSVDRVQGGAKLIDDAGKTIDKIVGSVSGMTGIISEIAAASREQLGRIDEVNRAVSQMEDVSRQSGALVERSAGAANSMADHANALFHAVARFALETIAEPAAKRIASRAGSGSRAALPERSAA